MMPTPVCSAYHAGRLDGSGEAALRPGDAAPTLRLIELAGFGAGQRVLDLCCGQGEGTALLERCGCRPLGLDADPAALRLARARHPQIDWLRADAGHPPLAPASLDGVLAECCLSLLPDRGQALAACRRLLRPGAPLAIADLCRRAEAPADARLPACLAGMTTPQVLCHELEAAGFTVERQEDHSGLLKALVVKLIFSAGSLHALWPTPDEAGDGLAILRTMRPGYFLFLARAG